MTTGLCRAGVGVIPCGMLRLRGSSGAVSAVLGGWFVAASCTPHERAQEPSSLCAAGMSLVEGGEGALAAQRFCMDTTEVTTAAYGACVQAGVCAPAVIGNGGGCNLTRADRGDHPINCTTWGQAQTFCGWVGKRLPDDDEWIWAARGPQAGDPFPWGKAQVDPTRACWDRKAVGTCPVGSTPAGASRAGVLDLIGNAAEWTRGRSEGAVARGRLRGGSFLDDVYRAPIDERIADSARDEPTEAATLASGIRCVVAPLTPVQEIDDSVWTPHRPAPPDGGLPVLAAAPARLAPTRPLANFAVLHHAGAQNEHRWSVGDGYVGLDVASATAIGLADPVHRPSLPEALRGFEAVRSLGGATLMAWSPWNDYKVVAVEPGAFKIRWQVGLGSRAYEVAVAPRVLVIDAYGETVDTLVGYALDSGRELWRLAGGPTGTFSRIRRLWVDGDRGYFLGDRGLSAFDTVSGAVVWTGVSVGQGCGVAGAADRLVVEDPAQGHRVLDPETGATVLHIRGAKGACTWDLGSWDGGTPGGAIEGDTLFAFDPPSERQATLRAFDLKTGAERWQRPRIGVDHLIADHDAVYVQRPTHLLAALDAATGETRGEVSVGSDFTVRVAQVGGAAGPVLIVDGYVDGTWVVGRAERPVAPENWVIRGRLVPEGIARKRVAGVPIKIGGSKVRTDAEGRFEARGRAVGAIGISLGTDRGPDMPGGSRVRFEDTGVVLTGKGTYKIADIELREWELY